MCDTIFLKYQGEVDLDINWFELYPDSVQELTPVTPDTKYKIVRITIFFDGDHVNNIETRRYITGVLMILIRNPIQWYTDRQNTIENSSYG